VSCKRGHVKYSSTELPLFNCTKMYSYMHKLSFKSTGTVLMGTCKELSQFQSTKTSETECSHLEFHFCGELDIHSI